MHKQANYATQTHSTDACLAKSHCSPLEEVHNKISDILSGIDDELASVNTEISNGLSSIFEACTYCVHCGIDTMFSNMCTKDSTTDCSPRKSYSSGSPSSNFGTCAPAATTTAT